MRSLVQWPVCDHSTDSNETAERISPFGERISVFALCLYYNASTLFYVVNQIFILKEMTGKAILVSVYQRETVGLNSGTEGEEEEEEGVAVPGLISLWTGLTCHGGAGKQCILVTENSG